MKNSLFALIMLVGLMVPTTMQAQKVLLPAEPSEVCQQAWSDYHKADILWQTGWGLFGGGTAMTVAGLLGWTLTPYESPYWHSWTNPGFYIMCIGGATFFASIPCLAIGQVRRKEALKRYEEWNCSPETCEEIKINYKQANTLWKTGWGLFGVGAGLALGGGVLAGTSAMSQDDLPPAERDPNKIIAAKTGWAIMGIGCGIFVASIPCLAVGQVRRKASQDAFGKKCADQPPLTFSLSSSPNGLGLTMNF